MNQEALISYLTEAGLIGKGCRAEFTPLTGGVSSEVWLVRQEGADPFVVKRSVAKLRVKADWFSDPARLRYEFLYLQTAAQIVPDAVPRLLTPDPDAPLLAMEYLGLDFTNWKSRMLEGDIRTDDAHRAGATLGKIHAATTGRADIPALFDTMEFFTQLRIDAYLRTTAEKQPPIVRDAISKEADRLSVHQECLVHGDYSPKNMLVGPERFVVLDCETACHGDPAFDLSFLLNHLLLKALLHAGTASGKSAVPALNNAIQATREAYRNAHPGSADDVEARTAVLLPMLALARVDGKSPVEYLDGPRQDFVRAAATKLILQCPATLDDIIGAWFQQARL